MNRLSPLILVVLLIAYLALLFWIARIGDRRRYSSSGWSRHPLVYTLALGVYCTSWTFYGLVGTAASRGWSYLPILLGPVLLFTLGFPLLQRIASICRQEHIHSIADFITSRYGKRQSVAVVVTLIMLAVTVPYIALQLKAVTDTLIYSVGTAAFASQDLTMFVAAAMLLFSLIFGANRLDVANYHSGIMVAIAFESFVKLFALAAVAIFALSLSQGFDLDVTSNMANRVFQEPAFTPSFWVLTLISAATIFCLPRMFQVTFVECLSEAHLKFARFGFSLYLFVIALAVFAISWIGNQTLTGTDVASDTFVLALPLGNQNNALGMLAFIGGFSAATAMIIVASLTLSQMLSNDVILPLLIRTQKIRNSIPDFSRSLMMTRRLTTVAVMLMAWLYQHSLAENVALTEIGLIAFALAVQIAPAIILGLYWQRANAMGVFFGLGFGVIVWFITLMLPLLCNAGFIDPILLEEGILGLDFLRPNEFLGFTFSDAYTRGVVLSLLLNIFAFYIISTLDLTRLSDRIQAVTFVKRTKRGGHPLAQGLKINKRDLISMLGQFLGESGVNRVVEHDKTPESMAANESLLSYSEQALAGVVGVASARAILNSLTGREGLGVEDVVHIFEATTRTLQFNQDMLFASFESISSSIIVVNADLKVVAWNKNYEDMFHYPKGVLSIGRAVADLLRFNAEGGKLGKGDVEQLVQARLHKLMEGKPYRAIRNYNGSIIEIKGRALPNGGYVTTYDDISEFIHAQKELEVANLNLEERVHERTQEVEKINESLRDEIELRKKTEVELIEAKSLAEFTNASKTQFLASASHDILQPLNAANLYASALLEKTGLDQSLMGSLKNLHGAIGSAEQIISNLLEISRLDTGALKMTSRVFPLSEIIEPLVNEYRVQVKPGVEFHWQESSLWAESDPKYLRRILQNFLSNAVKYCEQGRILIGCRRREGEVEVCIYDTGPGISDIHQQRIFEDFYRVSGNVEGAGLGLGIALRFANLLDHKISIQSLEGKGSLFSLYVPKRAPMAGEQKKSQALMVSSGLEGLKVFYVDDDENNIHALGALIDNWDCKLSSATGALQALEYLGKQAPPDAVLMDYQLGADVNGLELAEDLKKTWIDVPVCIVSAALDKDLATLIRSHGHDFLRKPIKPGKLRALLERYSKK